MLVPYPNRKRERVENDEGYGTSGFSEHRMKRRFASLPDRTSPKLPHQSSPFAMNYTIQPRLPTITPVDSESEDTPPASAETRSIFSPYSSSPAHTITPTSPSLDAMNSSQSTQMSDVSVYGDDMEMSDSVHLSPGPFHTGPSPSIAGRIPTPIHTSFASRIRAEKATLHHDLDFADDEAGVDNFRRGRRLPSPISERDTSPTAIVEGLGGMQMEYEGTVQALITPSKKGHTRSKHSLRSWTDAGEIASGAKRTFSMGYRNDCEKCRNKVPGHFNHIIAYD